MTAPPRSRDALVQQALQRWFGFDTLRPMQREAIDAALDGRDALVVLPTGGGKSLCYQLPALVLDRLVVVVSPLIALMQDQVDGLRLLGVPAAAAHGNLDAEGRAELRSLSAERSLRLLFVAPERLFLDGFQRWLQQQDVAAFAIDEAHCISQWGHDFRPEYRRLAELRAHFPGVPFQAFTATATPRVREDIAAQLRLSDPVRLVGTFDRPELTYRVLPRHDLEAQVVAAVRRHPDAAAIVYCIARKETEALASALQRHGIQARAYHAGLAAGERTRISADFRAERLHVVVATVAFGMGIDRSDVRLVVHAGMPKSLEAYQQETGRAGRDGLPAECLLLYSAADAAKWRALLESRTAEGEGDEAALQAQLALLQQMQRFAGRVRCRHRAISEYFGQAYTADSCGACDVCLQELEVVADGHVLAQKILSAVVRTGQRFGAAYVIDVLRGSRSEKVLQRGHDRIPTHGLCRDVPAGRLGNFIDQLVDQDLLVRTEGEYPTLQLGPGAMAVLKGTAQAVLCLPKQTLAARGQRRRAETGRAAAEVRDLTPAEQGLFEALRVQRRALAQELGVPPYVVANDDTLEGLARQRPADEAGLLAVRGIGRNKVATFGAKWLATLAAYCREHGLALGTESAEQSAEPSAPAVAPPPPVAVVEASRASTTRDEEPDGTPQRGRLAAFELFRSGASVDAVATALGRARSTVAGYLADWVEREPPADLRAWLDATIEARILGALHHAAEGRLKPVFEALGGTVDYDSIRLVLSWQRGCATKRGLTNPGNISVDPAPGP
ncbi:MAG: DNA helicase RecQ [Planctomycetes bacterium]|nr:DNA helicase RecQ [Planctomycetota bacterium]